MFVKRRDNAWVVTEINDDHNHPLIKKWSLTGYLRSHRHIPEEEQQFVKLLHSCNLEPSRQMQLLTELHGQREAIGYTDKDLANLLAKFRAEHKYTDMQDTIEYFKSSQQLDKTFFTSTSLMMKIRSNAFTGLMVQREGLTSFSVIVSLLTQHT
uniref:Protein FAR1-RELATED SEQUENCE n=1 Tax=Hordeum vulgare subsp. vulgare TaxID=112509 RepID=A0A8I6XCE4_HORVV